MRITANHVDMLYRVALAMHFTSPTEGAKIAFRLASSQGHLPLRQGESVECAKCGASGYAREVLGGDVHLKPCGAP